MTKADDLLAALPPADRVALTSALQNWDTQLRGRPLIPLADDVNGDGIADAWGLDDGGKLTIVLGVPLDDTVYATTEPKVG